MKLRLALTLFILITLTIYLLYAFKLQGASYWWFVIGLVLPLCLPISGTLKGRRYTVGYSSLLSTWYFFVSVSIFIFYDSTMMLVAAASSLLWFIACLAHNKKPKKSAQ